MFEFPALWLGFVWRFVVGDDRPGALSRAVRWLLGEDDPVQAIDVFVDELDLAEQL